MHLWRKLAEPHWFTANEDLLQTRSGGRLVVISRPERQRLQLEIACPSLDDSRKLIEEFGGVTEKWPRDWLRRFAERRRSKPLKIGKRLLILRAPKEEETHGFPYSLAIPASAAFGTGEHATTAMSLRLLERLTHKWKDGWSLADLGTGTGILALAAKRFGAGNVIGVDIDLKAISIAKANARLNKINNVAFRLCDLRKWKQSGRTNIVAANLYSELLIEILPNLNGVIGSFCPVCCARRKINSFVFYDGTTSR